MTAWNVQKSHAVMNSDCENTHPVIILGHNLAPETGGVFSQSRKQITVKVNFLTGCWTVVTLCFRAAEDCGEMSFTT